MLESQYQSAIENKDPRMPKYVAWREGLFIRPQHFQQNNFSHSSEMMTRTLISGENKWGFTSIAIDEQVLNIGKISCVSASGIMPDGTLFTGDDLLRPVTMDIAQTDEGKYIYLSLAINHENEKNIYFEEQPEASTRYLAKMSAGIPNTNNGEESTADIAFMYPNFKLSNEKEKGYVSMPIAKISTVSESGIVTLDRLYQPTYLHLHKANFIFKKLDELKAMVDTRADKILAKISTGGLKSTELRDYLILQLLNKYESKLHYYSTQDNIHPGDLYLCLTSFLSELTVFMTTKKRLENQFTYVHKNQFDCFTTLFMEITSILGLALESAATIIPLQKHNFGVHIALIQDKGILESSSFLLAISGDLEENQLKKLLIDNLKVGTVDEIRNLVNHHLPGFSYVSLATAPKEIPYRVNNLYFAISLKTNDRKKLAESSGVALHFPDTDKYKIEFTLWAIKKG